jgi:hypothetical protein
LTEGVQIALITNLTVIVVAFLSRLWSHIEHGKTERTANRTEAKVDVLMNGYEGKR